MPAWVVSAKESAERDRAAIEGGTPSRALMERAGTAAAREIERRYAERLRDGAVVFTGPGNNGGDGWVVASSLARSGVVVSVIDLAAGKLKSPEAVGFRQQAVQSVSVLDAMPTDAALVVDALLGTGFEGEPRGKIVEGIATINTLRARGACVAALDVPSGLDATSGEHSICVIADLTLTFGGVKRGTLIARDHCGEVVAVNIGLDDVTARVGSRPALPEIVDSKWVQSRIPPIHFDAHKGTRKHLAVVGGGKGMPGAVVLVAKAALRSGIGLVRTLVAAQNLDAIIGAVPTVLSSEWPTTANQIEAEISSWAHAAVLGPGLGKSKKTRALVEKILSGSTLPVLLDADALNVFEGDATTLGSLLGGRQALLTPHVAEFGRLANVDPLEVLANRFDIGTDLARTVNCTVLLKGTPTVVFSPHGDRYVIPRGTAALGTGGSGDMLAGIAGTMLAQLGDAIAAACCAAWVHGRAAELCGYVRGTTLDDVLYALPRAWNEPEPAPEPPVLTIIPAVST